MKASELTTILGEHAKWIKSSVEGKRANLSGADLSGADLSRADLYGADLSEANLSGANLSRAYLSKANLSKADLSGANLSRAGLSEANLSKADLSKANLSKTCLDPENLIPEIEDSSIIFAGLEIDGEYVYGYRTKESQHVTGTTYEVGVYTVPWFSIDITECHPGIYLASREWLDRNYSGKKIVRCRTLRKDLHKAGEKWRTRRLEVL